MKPPERHPANEFAGYELPKVRLRGLKQRRSQA